MDATTVADPERVAAADHRRGALGSTVVSIAWIALALWRPTVTYHLAPFLAAGAWPYLLRRGPLRVANADAVRGAIGGAGLTLLAALAIVAADAMRGPTLWGRGHVLLEVAAAVAAGAVVGFRVSRCSVAGT